MSVISAIWARFSAVTRRRVIVGAAYVAYMAIFWAVGITRAQFDSFAAFVVLTGIFAAAYWVVVNKILGKK